MIWIARTPLGPDVGLDSADRLRRRPIRGDRPLSAVALWIIALRGWPSSWAIELVSADIIGATIGVGGECRVRLSISARVPGAALVQKLDDQQRLDDQPRPPRSGRWRGIRAGTRITVDTTLPGGNRLSGMLHRWSSRQSNPVDRALVVVV